ncbi:MAG: calcium-translocating P-type ATPase, PMCA-type [Clostridia bacterium]|nr:calcium-translocating P-type ATPase, PMCA-type [Clostridia bacterium]
MKKEYKGLSPEEVIESRERYGRNELVKERRIGFFRQFFNNLSDPIIKVLLAALLIEVIFTFGHCNFLEVGGILCAVLIATTVSTVSELGSERAFESLEKENSGIKIRVVRDGSVSVVDLSDAVVGDLVLLGPGETVGADGVMIDGAVSVNQSALNGESADVNKKSAGSFSEWRLENEGQVFRGSVVTGGSGVMRVGRVGESTFYGGVAKDVQTSTRESPLKLRLSKLASQISKIGYVMAILVGLTYLFNTYVADLGFDLRKTALALSDGALLFENLLHALTLMITVVVVAVPEGLPMMITVILSANMRKMLRDKVLVKKLVGIETAGSLNILFTDKTGTLTTGKLECDAVVTEDGVFKSSAALSKLPTVYELLCINAKYNTDTELTGKLVTGGNATDRAVAEFFLNDGAEKVDIIKKKPFSSEDKISYITLKNGKTVIKGAAELIISRSKYRIDKNGACVASTLDAVKRAYSEATQRGDRAIAVAVCDGEWENMTFVALILLKDKLRRGVKEAVSVISGAGIQTVMLTGDGIKTACSIAEECGIYKKSAGHVALTSAELQNLSDEEVKAIIPKLRVIARALPSDKMRLVKLAQELELVVGMTGDGINDAPSLKLADVGFAMGDGTDVAKGAADVVILDNSLGAIGKTVLYGRMIFRSIRKFITFQLIMNLAACGVSLIGQFIGIDNPITVIQMLWINIIMDTLGGLAFAGEPALKYYMKEKPKKREEPILSREMLNGIIFTGLYTLGLCVAFLKLDFFRERYVKDGDTAVYLTAFYALFVFAGIFNALSARSERLWIFSNIGKNKPFIIIMLLISAIQVLMIYFGGAVFRTVPLSAHDLLPVIGLSSSVLLFDFLRRIVYKLK